MFTVAIALVFTWLIYGLATAIGQEARLPRGESAVHYLQSVNGDYEPSYHTSINSVSGQSQTSEGLGLGSGFIPGHCESWKAMVCSKVELRYRFFFLQHP